MIKLKFKNKLRIVFGVVLVSVLGTSNAYAYLDPASGGAILSAVIGFIVACGVFLKTYWYKLKKIFSKTKNNK